MSVSDVVARVQELQQLIGGRPAAPAPAPRADFAATLAGATAGATAAGSPPILPSAATAPAGAVTGVPYADEINAAAARHKLDPALLAA